MFLFSFLS